jgi:hypothetical protein
MKRQAARSYMAEQAAGKDISNYRDRSAALDKRARRLSLTRDLIELFAVHSWFLFFFRL